MWRGGRWLAAAAVSAALVAAVPVPAQPLLGLPGPCDVAVLSALCGAPGTVAGALLGPVAAPIVGAVADSAEQALTSWLARSAASMLGDVFTAASRSVEPQLGTAQEGVCAPAAGCQGAGRPVFAASYATMAGLAGGVALLFLLFAVAASVIRGDPMLALRAAFVRLPVAFVVMGGALAVTGLCLRVVDEATTAVVGTGMDSAAGAFVAAVSDAYSTAASGGANLAVVALVALFSIVAALLVYIELLVRAALVYLVLFFLPLGLAASVWPAAARTARRLLNVLVAAVLSKFVIVTSLWLGARLLAAGAGGGELGTMLVGLVVLVLAAGSPLFLVGLVAHAEEAVATLAQGRREVGRHAARAASAGRLAAARAGAAAGTGRGPTARIASGGSGTPSRGLGGSAPGGQGRPPGPPQPPGGGGSPPAKPTSPAPRAPSAGPRAKQAPLPQGAGV